jgi:PEP-CTERM motif-containing protein
MPTRLIRLMLAIAVGALYPARAAGDPIRVYFIERAANATVNLADGTGDHTDFQQAADLLHVAVTRSSGTNTASASATLASDVSDPTHLSATAVNVASVAMTDAGVAGGGGTITIGLELDTPHAFEFVGTFGMSAGQCCRFMAEGRGLWSAVLTGEGAGSATVFSHFSPSGPSLPAQSAVITEAGLLAAGRWLLIVNAAAIFYGPASGTSTSDYGVTLNLSDAAAPVPEPASMFLVGTGILGLVGAARRRRRSVGTCVR